MGRRERIATCLLALVGACRYQPTEVLVTLGTDVDPTRSIDVRVMLGTGAATPTNLRYETAFGAGRDGGTLPQSFAITPRAGEALDDTVSLEIRASIAARDATDPAVTLTRRARFRFTPHSPTVLPIFLTLACAAPASGCQHAAPGTCTVETLCDERGMTCGNDGTCVPVDQTLAPLPADAEAHPGDTGMPRDSGPLLDAADSVDVPVGDSDVPSSGSDVPTGLDVTTDDAPPMDAGIDAPIDAAPDVPADTSSVFVRDGGACTQTAIAGSTSAEGTIPPTDGHGSAALFGAVYTIRADRATNTILVAESGRLRRVTLAGDVTTLFGGAPMCGTTSSLATQYSSFGVDSTGSIFWLCLDSSLHLHRLTAAGAHTQATVTGLPSSVAALNVGRDDAVYAVWTIRSGATMFQPFVARIDASGAGTTVFTGAITAAVLTSPTDIVVGTDRIARVEDPNATVIRRIDLTTGTLLSDQPGSTGPANQHLALDAAGNVYAMGRELTSDGRTLTTFPNWTAQFGIDVIGATDDIVEAHCVFVTAWACEINLFQCP